MRAPDQYRWKRETAPSAGPAPAAEPAGQQDMRHSDRSLAVYKSVIISVREYRIPCLIRNISAGGMMGIVCTKLPVGIDVAVEMHPGLVVLGKVKWSNDAQFGLAFDHQIDVAQILATSAKREVDGQIKRSPRLALPCDGLVRHEGIEQRVQVLDLSQGGARIGLAGFGKGQLVRLTIPALGSRKAAVSWEREESSGLKFLLPIRFEEWAAWAIANQQR